LRVHRLIPLLLVVGLVAAACGQDADTQTEGSTTSLEQVSGPFTVPEARAVADGRMSVTGSILRVGIGPECDADATCPAVIFEMHLCGAMTRSVPPQCVGDFFYLRGIDPGVIEFQEAPDGTGWSAPVLITGRKQGEAFIGETVE
jgi:hypothetical protein